MNIVVITAGGIGARMHSKDKPKQFLEIQGKPIIIHTMLQFEKCDAIDAIIVACVEGWIDYTETLVSKYNIKKVKKIVLGGETGQISIYNGLCEASKLSPLGKNIVLVHDGVRPLINTEIIKKVIESVEKQGATVVTGKVKETVVEIDDNGNILQIPKRDKSRHAKAPQGFWLNDLLEIHKRAISEGKRDFVDSCSMVFYYGMKVHTIEGTDENIKVTTPQDFYSMRAILTAKEDSQIYGYE